MGRRQVLTVLIGAVVIAGGTFLLMRRTLRSAPTPQVTAASSQAVPAYEASLQTDETCIEVVDAADQKPLAGARIQLLAAQSQPVITDAQGCAAIPPGKYGPIVITAPGYCGLREYGFVARAGRHTFALHRAGGVEFAIEGDVLEGVEIMLDPPRGHGINERPRPRRSDATGHAAWRELRVADGYTWAITSAHPVVVAGAVDDELIPDDTRGRAPLWPSGTFDVRAGETTRIVLRVARPAGVRGRIVGPDGRGVALVKVTARHHGYVQSNPAFRTHTTVVEKSATTDGDGRFDIQGIKAGRKDVQSSWTVGARTVVLRVPFRLERGELRNLGDISPAAGHIVRGRVRFNPAEALPAELRARLPGKKAGLTIFHRPEGSRGEGLTETLDVPFGDEFEIHGLGDGELSAMVDCGLVWSKEKGATFANPTPSRVRLPGQPFLDLCIEVTVVAAVTVRVPVPDNAARTAFDAYLVRSTDGFAVEFEQTRPKDGFVEFTGQAPPGVYEVWVVPDPVNSQGGAANCIARAHTSVGNDAVVVEAALQPGATVSGRVVNADGSPCAREPVQFTVVHGGVLAKARLHWTMSNERGEFTLPGVEPGCTLASASPYLTPASGGDTVPIGAAGSVTKVELVKRSRR